MSGAVHRFMDGLRDTWTGQADQISLHGRHISATRRGKAFPSLQIAFGRVFELTAMPDNQLAAKPASGIHAVEGRDLVSFDLLYLPNCRRWAYSPP